MNILVTGDFHQPEFKSLVDVDVHSSVRRVDWSSVLESGTIDADLLVIAQARRGQFTQRQVYELMARYPLTQKVIVLGSWCEGETRSGRPMRGIHRVFLSDWPVVLSTLNRQWQKRRTTDLVKPTTIVDTMWASGVNHSSSHLRVHLFTKTPDSRDCLSDFCQSRGWAVADNSKSSVSDVAIIECRFSIREVVSIVKQANLDESVPLLCICGFIRTRDVDWLLKQIPHRFQAMGKPFNIDLLAQAAIELTSGSHLRIVTSVA